MNETKSILVSIKKLLGLAADYTAFDTDIMLHINSVFMILNQLGVGPKAGFAIKGDAECWTDFLPDTPKLEAVKSYTYLKVRLMFDPPTSSSVLESYQRQISELEWRINAVAET